MQEGLVISQHFGGTASSPISFRYDYYSVSQILMNIILVCSATCAGWLAGSIIIITLVRFNTRSSTSQVRAMTSKQTCCERHYGTGNVQTLGCQTSTTSCQIFIITVCCKCLLTCHYACGFGQVSKVLQNVLLEICHQTSPARLMEV